MGTWVLINAGWYKALRLAISSRAGLEVWDLSAWSLSLVRAVNSLRKPPSPRAQAIRPRFVSHGPAPFLNRFQIARLRRPVAFRAERLPSALKSVTVHDLATGTQAGQEASAIRLTKNRADVDALIEIHKREHAGLPGNRACADPATNAGAISDPGLRVPVFRAGPCRADTARSYGAGHDQSVFRQRLP